MTQAHTDEQVHEAQGPAIAGSRSRRPAAETSPPGGALGTVRYAWAVLTSMRTAIILLFALAIAAVPGGLLPQRPTGPFQVLLWKQQNPRFADLFEVLGLFDVYSSPWFAAVYLLLFISLVGCVLPRIRQHARAMTAPPPAAPRRMSRMPVSREFDSADAEDDLLERARAHLSSRRWRTRTGESPDGSRWVAAEKGYLRETGNLVFHLALLFVLVAIAVGGLLGWKGNVIVREGSGFSNTLTQYDAWGGGRFVDADDLAPFSFSLDRFTVDFERTAAQRGAPRLFEADVTYRSSPGAPDVAATIEVNEPLQVDGAKVFLVGHGYAPHFVIRDSTGAVVFDDAVVFLPQDGNFTSTGVIKVPDGDPPLGFNGLFLPTAARDGSGAGSSTFPAADNPEILLSAFRGDMGLDTGVPQSVYTLDTSQMVKVGLEALAPGQTWDLPNDSGSIEFTGYERWASFQIAHDPGKELALLASLIAIAGLMLSLFVRRRRVWVKVAPAGDAATLVQVAGLAKTDVGGLPDEVAEVAALLGEPGSTERRSEP